MTHRVRYSAATQLRVLAAVEQLVREGTPATSAQIAIDLPDLGPQALKSRLTSLRRADLVASSPGAAHAGYRLTDAGRALLEAP